LLLLLSLIVIVNSTPATLLQTHTCDANCWGSEQIFDQDTCSTTHITGTFQYQKNGDVHVVRKAFNARECLVDICCESKIGERHAFMVYFLGDTEKIYQIHAVQ